MKIVISGGYRVGSTWAYNVLRGLTGWPSFGVSEGEMKTHLDSPGNRLIKCHMWRPIYLPPDDKVKIVLPTRCSEGVAASLLALGQDYRTAARTMLLGEQYSDWLKAHAHWVDGVYELFYCHIKDHPQVLLCSLRSFVEVLQKPKVDLDIIRRLEQARVKAECSAMTESMDPISHFRKNHITNSDPKDIPEAFWEVVKEMKAKV